MKRLKFAYLAVAIGIAFPLAAKAQDSEQVIPGQHDVKGPLKPMADWAQGVANGHVDPINDAMRDLDKKIASTGNLTHEDALAIRRQTLDARWAIQNKINAALPQIQQSRDAALQYAASHPGDKKAMAAAQQLENAYNQVVKMGNENGTKIWRGTDYLNNQGIKDLPAPPNKIEKIYPGKPPGPTTAAPPAEAPPNEPPVQPPKTDDGGGGGDGGTGGGNPGVDLAALKQKEADQEAATRTLGAQRQAAVNKYLDDPSDENKAAAAALKGQLDGMVDDLNGIRGQVDGLDGTSRPPIHVRSAKAIAEEHKKLKNSGTNTDGSETQNGSSGGCAPGGDNSSKTYQEVASGSETGSGKHNHGSSHGMRKSTQSKGASSESHHHASGTESHHHANGTAESHHHASGGTSMANQNLQAQTARQNRQAQLQQLHAQHAPHTSHTQQRKRH